MRDGLIDGLSTPHPLLDLLPSVYRQPENLRDDPVSWQLTQILDDLLAPVLCVLDNLGAYIDPELAPLDFVEWLGGWVGFPIGETWPENRSRELVARAWELYGGFGTVKGLRALLATYVGVEPDITDTGGVSWSTALRSGPGDAPSERATKRKAAKSTKAASTAKGAAKAKMQATTGPSGPHLTVRLPAGRGVDLRQVEALISEAKPAHVTHTLEVGR